MGIFNFLKKKKGEEYVSKPITLPEDLEKFRIGEIRKEIHEEKEILHPPSLEPIEMSKSYEIKEKPKTENYDKIELILQKLETIDARLKLIEEKLNKI
ncbi:MAG: hypothetical protein QXF15_02045 [Candidatus Aenigmatarchaeota archaeon]